MKARSRIARGVALLSAVVLFVGTALARAQETLPLQFVTFQQCWGNGDYCFPRVLVEGDIPADAASQFERFVAGSHLPGLTVCFNSPGGSVGGAIDLGRVIRRNGMDTCIEPSYETVGDDLTSPNRVFVPSASCASACVLAFMGGVNRTIDQGSLVGVHQFSGAFGPLGDSLTQFTQTRLAAYLDEMGVNRRLLDVASTVLPSSVHWLSLDDARSVGLDNMTPQPIAWKLDTTSDGMVFAVSGVTRPGPRSNVGVFLFSRAGRPTAYVNFIPADSDQQAALNALRTDTPVRFIVDGAVIGETASTGWIARANPQVSIEVPLQPTAFDALAAGSTLELAVFVPEVYRQYDPSVALPLAGLSEALPALGKTDTASVAPAQKPERPRDELEVPLSDLLQRKAAGWFAVVTTDGRDWLRNALNEGAAVALCAMCVALGLFGFERFVDWLKKPPSA